MFVNALLNLTLLRLRSQLGFTSRNSLLTAGVTSIPSLAVSHDIFPKRYIEVFQVGLSFFDAKGGNLGRDWKLGIAIFMNLSLDQGIERYTKESQYLNQSAKSITNSLELWQPGLGTVVILGFSLANSSIPLPLDTLYGHTSHATGTILEVNWTSGNISDASAIGTMLVLKSSGTFVSEVCDTSSASNAGTNTNTFDITSNTPIYDIVTQPIRIDSERQPQVTDSERNEVCIVQTYSVQSLSSIVQLRPAG